MDSAFHMFCPKYGGPLTSTVPMTSESIRNLYLFYSFTVTVVYPFFAYCYMCLRVGQLKIINFPFVPMGKLIIFWCPKN